MRRVLHRLGAGQFALHDEFPQRLVEASHSMRGAGLDHRQDLGVLVFTNQVAQRRHADQHLDRPGRVGTEGLRLSGLLDGPWAPPALRPPWEGGWPGWFPGGFAAGVGMAAGIPATKPWGPRSPGGVASRTAASVETTGADLRPPP